MNPSSVTAELTYLTADLPGIGGSVKQRPEDFLVEEQPLYQPVGHGEHLMLFIEKKQLTTQQFVRRLARLWNIKPRDIGYAGLKDKQAVTRQHLTVWLPGQEKQDAEKLALAEKELPGILWSQRHENKLKRGHLAANQFVIYIRDVEPTHVIRAKAILDQLTTQGIPNYLGDQRFGISQNNHLLGQHLLREQYQGFLDQMLGQAETCHAEVTFEARQAYDAGDFTKAIAHWPRGMDQECRALNALRQGKSPRDAVMAMDRTQRQFLIAAAQSDLFNRVLDQRLRDGQFAEILPGDLALKHENHSVFLVDDEVAGLEMQADGRMTTHEISPTGPLWGSKMMQAQNSVGQVEQTLLHEAGMAETDWKHVSGARRSLRTLIRYPDLCGGSDENGPYIRLSFEMDRGCFATIVLREIMKAQ